MPLQLSHRDFNIVTGNFKLPNFNFPPILDSRLRGNDTVNFLIHTNQHRIALGVSRANTTDTPATAASFQFIT